MADKDSICSGDREPEIGRLMSELRKEVDETGDLLNALEERFRSVLSREEDCLEKADADCIKEPSMRTDLGYGVYAEVDKVRRINEKLTSLRNRCELPVIPP